MDHLANKSKIELPFTLLGVARYFRRLILGDDCDKMVAFRMVGDHSERFNFALMDKPFTTVTRGKLDSSLITRSRHSKIVTEVASAVLGDK
jgi:hypothetical protein